MGVVITDKQKAIIILTDYLGNLLSEHKNNRELIFDCFYDFTYGANVDSEIIVAVLENFKDDEIAKDIILRIKVNEGW